MSGHVFVVQGDLLLLDCDAWLAPTDERLATDEPWRSHVLEPTTPPGWGMHGLRAVRADPVADEAGPVPRPWLVNTGAWSGVPVGWYREGVRQFVDLAASDLRGTTPRNARSRHLLALPVVGTGAGGAADVKGEITRALLDQLRTDAGRHDIDIALVTHDARAYAAAQLMRRRTGMHRSTDLPAALEGEVARLAEEARRGRLVVFLGAGIGAGAGLPRWEELLARLADDAGMTVAERDAMARLQSPLDRARIIEGRLAGRGTLADAVRRALGPARRASLAHLLTASLPVREAATTNYDDLFERAVRATGRRLSVLPYEPSDGEAWLLKMHGSLVHGDDIVLTRDDYLSYAERRAALKGIVQALLFTRHMLFVGFSLTDDNFHRVAHDVRRAIGRSGSPFGTALFLAEEPLLPELWRGEVRFLSMAAADEDPAAAPTQARRLEMFLDRLGLEASDPANHLLDPTYEGLLTDSELALRSRLLALRDAVSRDERATPAWSRVGSVLRELGG